MSESDSQRDSTKFDLILGAAELAVVLGVYAGGWIGVSNGTFEHDDGFTMALVSFFVIPACLGLSFNIHEKVKYLKEHPVDKRR
jgi:hypothetical protein